MKRLFTILFFTAALQSLAQPVIKSWILNAGGKHASYWANNGGRPPTYTFTSTTDSADVLKVCYNADTVWMRSQNMTDNMGKWFNPGSAVPQNWVHRFPRTPLIPFVKVVSPKLGEIGMLINGIAIYGLSNANSWTGTANATPQQGGQGVWNVEVGLSEGFVLDTAFGAHPQQQGVYHSHTTPFRLYKNMATTKHSPLVGWAFDGYPIYGPYGYSSALDSTSAVTRMKSGYSMRNITTRTTLPGGATASQSGPPVSTTYPIGTYCEDYEWLASNGGDLDEYNGRNCITPEFPQGTYAYFVTIDAAGKAQFPYYIGIQYYGQPDAGNFSAGPNGNGLSVPAYISSCITPAASTGVEEMAATGRPFMIYPNPSAGEFTISSAAPLKSVRVLNAVGQTVYHASFEGRNEYQVKLQEAEGIYLLLCEEEGAGKLLVSRLLVK